MSGHEERSTVDFRVGASSPLGQGLRRHWVPACFSHDLPQPDCDPVGLRLLGERFVAFRDSAGAIGILDEFCPHRRASLVYGRNENGGLRCLWHRWKFGVDGQVHETPNTTDCTLRERVRAKAYPVRESGGIVWTYLGETGAEPAFHEFGWSKVGDNRRLMCAVDLDCNFSKGLEALMDSSHVSLLHADSIKKSPVFRSSIPARPSQDHIDAAPELRIETTDFGFHYVSLRRGEAERYQARLSVFVAPYLCFVAPENSAFLCVPRDDTHMRMYIIAWSPRIPITPALRADWVRFMGLDPQVLSACGLLPTGPAGPIADQNRFVQDRRGMRAGETYSGLPGLTAEDAAMMTSIPGISSYVGEHLTASDAAIVQLRRTLWKLARDTGDIPCGFKMGVSPEAINSCARVLSNPNDWREMIGYLPRAPATA